MFFQWDSEQQRKKYIQRKSYLMTVGDDHLHWSNKQHLLADYKKILQSEYNQAYNTKADFISTTGAVIAEHCMVIKPTQGTAYEVCFIRPKQLLEEEGDTIAWIDKLRSIRATMSYLYISSNLRHRDTKWKKIFRAQQIFIYNHQNYFNIYLTETVSPFLPFHLGGLDVEGYVPFNLITKKHLRNLNFLCVYSQELLYWYQKRIAKARASATIRLSKPHRSFIHAHKGHIPYPKAVAKDILYGLGGVLIGLSSEILEKKKKTLFSLIKEYNNVIEEMYKYISQELNFEHSPMNKSSWKDHFILLKLRNSQSAGPYWEDELVMAQYPQCEANYEIVSSSVREVKKEFKKTFHLGERDYGWQPIGHVKPEKVTPLIDLNNLCFLQYLPVKPIKDPGLYFLDAKAAIELELLRNLSLEERQKIDRARILNELTEIHFNKSD